MGNIRNEYERLKQNLQKLEEDYDDLKARKDEELNEKEQTIIDYKQKISEIDIYYQTQLNSCLEEIQSLQDSRRKNLGSINPEVKIKYEK